MNLCYTVAIYTSEVLLLILYFAVLFARLSFQCVHFFLAGLRKVIVTELLFLLGYIESNGTFIRSCFQSWYQTTLQNKAPKPEIEVPLHLFTAGPNKILH